MKIRVNKETTKQYIRLNTKVALKLRRLLS